MELEVATTRVRPHFRHKVGTDEIAVVLRSLGTEPEYKYHLSNADPRTSRGVLAQVATHQHRIEESFQVAKSDLGMDHYEVRSWIGWHHHMTMCFLGQWFLVREHRRMGEKNAGAHGPLDRHAPQEGVA
jgi:SRSO17 transposase